MELYMSIGPDITGYSEWLPWWLEIDKNKLTKGCEVQGDVDYEKFARHIYPLDLQIHGLDLEDKSDKEIANYFRSCERPAQLLGHKIKVTLHPSLNYKEINQISEGFQIQLAWENKTHFIDSFVRRKLCWDICHDVINGNVDCYLPQDYRSKIINVHLSDIKDDAHYPFSTFRVNCFQAIKRLREYGYDLSIVLEMWINYFRGDSIPEKLNQYLRQFELVHSMIDLVKSNGGV